MKGSFLLSTAMVIVGALLKITHSDGADTLMAIGFIVGILFTVATIYEVTTSIHIDRTEKIMWTLEFIFMNGVAGFVYLLSGKKRVVRELAQ